MNTRLFEEASAQMEAAELIAQEMLEMARMDPTNVGAIEAKREEYGSAFVAASAALAEATYAEEDPE